MSAVAPSNQPVQQDSIQFNQPISEASLAGMGGPINALLQIMLPVGTVLYSVLSDVGSGSAVNSFQGQLNFPNPSTWILADGRNVAGSIYEGLTGNANAPDLRGIMLRGLNNGGSTAGTRSDAYANPDDPTGTFTAGTLTQDRFAQHTHTANGVNAGGGETPNLGSGAIQGPATVTTSVTGGAPGIPTADTAPKNASLNAFIRIN